MEELPDRQSQEADAGERKVLVWEIERRLAEDVANPIILHNVGYGCRINGRIQRLSCPSHSGGPRLEG